MWAMPMEREVSQFLLVPMLCYLSSICNMFSTHDKYKTSQNLLFSYCLPLALKCMKNFHTIAHACCAAEITVAMSFSNQFCLEGRDFAFVSFMRMEDIHYKIHYNV